MPLAVDVFVLHLTMESSFARDEHDDLTPRRGHGTNGVRDEELMYEDLIDK